MGAFFTASVLHSVGADRLAGPLFLSHFLELLPMARKLAPVKRLLALRLKYGVRRRILS
jgi:hypothetical protein